MSFVELIESLLEGCLEKYREERYQLFRSEAKKFCKIGGTSGAGGTGLMYLTTKRREQDLQVQFMFMGSVIDSEHYRETGVARNFQQALMLLLDAKYDMSIEDFKIKVLNMMRMAWLHEFEELMYYDGKPVYNPHVEGGKLAPGVIIIDELKVKRNNKFRPNIEERKKKASKRLSKT